MLHVLRETSLGRHIAFLLNGPDFSCSYIGLPIKFLLKNFISLKNFVDFLLFRGERNYKLKWHDHSRLRTTLPLKKKKKSNWLVACLPKTCENILAPPNTPGNGQGRKLTGSDEGSWLESCLFQNHEHETAAWADQTEFLACSNSVMLKNILIPYTV